MMWIKTGKTVNREGTTITYTARERKSLTIESRKRHIPHAAKGGTWDHTTYVVMIDGKDVKEIYTLRDAKAFAEGLIVDG